MKDLLKTKEKYDSMKYESESSKEKLAVMIPVLNECSDPEEEEGERTQEFKKELVSCKKSIKKSFGKKAESVDLYMKEINTELTKQDMYREINKCAFPLLPAFQVIEKRGGDPSKNQVVDYSVKTKIYRSITTSSWPTRF